MHGASKALLRTIPQSQNLTLSAISILLQFAGLVLTPLAWGWKGWAFALWVVLYGYGTVLTWLLIHEAIHFKLHSKRRINDLLGRVHAVLFGCPFHILKVGHMSHHRYNRSVIDTNELIPADAKHAALWWFAYYARIMGFLYVSEVISPLAFFFWSRSKRFIRRLIKDDTLEAILDLFTRRIVHTIRFDAFLCLGWFALQFYANWSDLRPLLILLLARACIISVYDNAYHYGTDPHDAAAAYNLTVPRLLQPLILNHNMHRVHHRHPAASWTALPELFAADSDRFDGALVATGIKQFKGPVRRPALAESTAESLSQPANET
jgi:fatty acid desaturase